MLSYGRPMTSSPRAELPCKENPMSGTLNINVWQIT
jgi:hypothetical protein